ncbi:DUF2029 domain-containing protein [Candidatus Dojkabacteria bacterium]|nr:DUF2029 domain-containing protein [Candidatus Dojkabacteria bacterium]
MAEEESKSIWEAAFNTCCITIIILSIFFIEVGLLRYLAGGDFNIYCGAVRTYDDGCDPYVVSNVKIYSDSPFSFIYPPLSLFFLKLLRFLDSVFTYHLIWVLLLLFVYFIVKRGDTTFKPLFFVTLLTSCFAATFWNFLVGNVGLIELSLFAFIFLGIINRKHRLPAFIIGVLSFLKITSVFYSILLLFSRTSKREKMRLFSLVVLTFLLLHLLSYILFPGISSSYYLSLTGGIDNQHSPIFEKGGVNNPSMFFLINEAAERIMDGNNELVVVLYALFVLFVLFTFYRYTREKRSYLKLFSFGVLCIMLILPRFKPYSLTFAILPVYFLAKGYDFKKKILFVLITCLCPMVFFSFGYLSSLNFLTSFLWNYGQLVCFASAFLLFSYNEKLILKRSQGA